MNHDKKSRRTAAERRGNPKAQPYAPAQVVGKTMKTILNHDQLVAGPHLPDNKFPPLRVLERDYIQKVLCHVGHSRTKAASILGIDRVSLWRKMKKHEIIALSASALED